MAALVSQLVLGSLVLPDEAATGAVARLRDGVVLCTSAATRPGTPVRHRHHPVGLAACPLEIALELPAVIPTPAIMLPSLMVPTGTRLFVRPPARAPLAAFAWAPHARGPPA